MKSLFFCSIALLSLSTQAFAASSSSRGYMSELNGSVSYVGLTDANVDIQLHSSKFTETQISEMAQCMNSRNTHAILVETESRAIPVPSGIPGRSTNFHETKVVGVSCVPAPGFLRHWRNTFLGQ